LREKEVDSSFNQKEDCFVVLNKKEKKSNHNKRHLDFNRKMEKSLTIDYEWDSFN